MKTKPASTRPVNSRGEATGRNGERRGVRRRAQALDPVARGSSPTTTRCSCRRTFPSITSSWARKTAWPAGSAVAKMPGKAYNPFFIHGGVGLGKTHLLQAICQEGMRRNRQMRVYYTSCNDFVNRWHKRCAMARCRTSATASATWMSWSSDDIHDIAHDRLQEEFFRTSNTLHQHGKQVVLSSDAAPCEISGLEERLTSRFNCGLVARIDKPCFETRVGIVLKKAALHNLSIPDDRLVCRREDRLEHPRTRRRDHAHPEPRHDARRADRSRTRQAGHRRASGRRQRRGDVDPDLDAITEFYDVRLTDLLSKRPKSITHPRQIGMYFARHLTRFSLEEIGSYFGGRDHTTVMHAIRTVDERRRRDPELDRELALFEQKLKNNGGKRAGLVGPARSTPTRRRTPANPAVDSAVDHCRFAPPHDDGPRWIAR